jgi:hypothetical protein
MSSTGSMKYSTRTALFCLSLITPTTVLAQPEPPPAEPPAEPSGQESAPPAVPDAEAPKPAAPPDQTTEKPAPPATKPNAAEAPTAAPGPNEPVSEAALQAELEAIGGATETRGLTLSGFMDFNLRHTFHADQLLQSTDKRDSFYIGSLNIYFRGNINPKLRTLAEVRFTYLPNGAPDNEGDFQRTATDDYANHDRPVDLGSIEIERAHGEYEFDQALIVRAGQFLTPYGIWNVDHGSPIVISVTIPYVISNGLIPERQTGVELLGSFDLSDNIQLRHHLTLSNGRGPFESHYDLDRNKAIGGRLQLVMQSDFGDLSLGSSAYYGRYTDGGAPDQDGRIPITVQYDELGLAGDVKWTFKGAQLQSEFVHQQIAYTEAGRRLLAPDRAAWGAYVLAGYRIPVVELMPFVMIQRIDYGAQGQGHWAYAGGLNYRPYPELVLKAQATLTKLEWQEQKAESTKLETQIAWAF